MQTISIINYKGCIGKMSIVVNKDIIVNELSRGNKKVIQNKIIENTLETKLKI